MDDLEKFNETSLPEKETAKFLSTPGLAYQAALKKTKVK